MFVEEFRFFFECSVSVEEDDILFVEFFVNFVVNYFRFVLGGNVGN